MSATEMWSTNSKIEAPPHVPKDLVRSIDLWNAPSQNKCPFSHVTDVQEEQPRIFYNLFDPQCGSSWVITRAEDLRMVLTDPDSFSSSGTGALSALFGETWPLIPLDIDPPLHGKYRSILNPFFSPAAISKLSDGIRKRATALIDKFADKSGCEFMADFGLPFPVGVFLELMGLPEEEMFTFLGWNNDLNHDTPISVKIPAGKAIRDYLIMLRDSRRRNPVQDLASYILAAEIDGKRLSDEEVLGIYYLVFIAGLDTVASSLGTFFHHLAQNQPQQERLRADRSVIPHAAEEMLRAFSPVLTRRLATKDVEIAGTTIKKGDWITCITAFGSRDPLEHEDPTTVDFNRNSRHFGFMVGPHFCLGANLARRELHIALEEWGQRIPLFRLQSGFSATYKNGGVIGLKELQLVWN